MLQYSVLYCTVLVTHVPVPVLYIADDPVIESDITQKSSS